MPDQERELRRMIVPPGQYAAAAARRIAGELRDAVARRGAISLALAGGGTPQPVYAALARLAGVPWPEVTVYFGDERAVPPDHPESNYRMAREALLDPAGLSPDQVCRMQAERADRGAAAADYARLLPGALDLLLLGLGHDGHTASLFPASPAVREYTRAVVPSESPVPPVHRLTITPPVIAAAREVIVLVTGAEKAAMVARVLEGPYDPERLPAQLARRGCWLLDEAAAAHLTRREQS